MAKFVRVMSLLSHFHFLILVNPNAAPPLVINPLEGNDNILCQITSKNIRDHYAISFEDIDFEAGGLKQASNIRTNRLFAADNQIILYRMSKIKNEKLAQVIKKVIEIIKG
jgi:mRNA interferase MazF